MKDVTNSVENENSGGNDDDENDDSKKLTDVTLLVEPSVRLNRERLRLLQEVGFVWLLRRSGVNNGKNSVEGSQHCDSSVVENSSENENMNTVDNPEKKDATRTAKRKATGKKEKPSPKQRKNDIQWPEMYERLQQYKVNYGDCLVPKGFKDDPKLASW